MSWKEQEERKKLMKYEEDKKITSIWEKLSQLKCPLRIRLKSRIYKIMYVTSNTRNMYLFWYMA
jgi:hypothetical protein